MVQQWRKFPFNPQKKEALIILFAQRIKTRQAKPRDKVVFVACEEECNQFSPENAFTPGVGKGESHMKGAGMLVVSLRGVNFGFWSSSAHALSLRRPWQVVEGGGGGGHVARLNFKTSRVGVYKCLSQFGRGRLSLVAISFYALSLLFGPCRLSELRASLSLDKKSRSLSERVK